MKSLRFHQDFYRDVLPTWVTMKVRLVSRWAHVALVIGGVGIPAALAQATDGSSASTGILVSL
jgi:hypothetical protein